MTIKFFKKKSLSEIGSGEDENVKSLQHSRHLQQNDR